MNFIRKNKEKSNKNLDKAQDLPPSLTLPSFSSDVSVPIVATSPSPHPPPNLSPLPERSPSSTSPPLYAKFARGTFELREPELLSPSAPRQTLRHRSSNESGAGFRSSGVRDEVERLVVAKRNAIGAKSGRDSPSVKAPSIRSVMSGRDSPLPSLSEAMENPNQRRRTPSQPSVVLPRPPTPPPPSPPKIIFAKSLPTSSSEKSLPAAPSLPAASPPMSPSPILIPKTPPSKILPLSSPVSSPSTLLSSPAISPGASRRRAYSPLAAFHSIKDNSNALVSNVVDTNGKDQDIPSSNTVPSTSASTPTTPASTLFMSSSSVTGTSTSSSPNTINSPIKNSAALSTANSNEAGNAGILRRKSANKNGIAQTGSLAAESESSSVKGSSFVIREKGYFAMYPDRDKVKRTVENFDASSTLNKVNSSNGEPVTPISSRPSKSSFSTVDDDDPNLQAFVKNLPSSVSRHTTGDSEASSVASNILASAAFGETNRRIPRGARLSRIGSGFSNGNGVEETQMNASPVPFTDRSFGSASPVQALSRKTSGSVFEETLASKIPTASANASTSTLNSLSTHSRDHSHNSTPNTPSSSRAASKSESVRDRVRALEEEREREKEKERLRRSSPWVRKDGTVAIKPKREEKESNGSRSVSSSTIVQQTPSVSPIHETTSIEKRDSQKVDETSGSSSKLEETFTSLHPEIPLTKATTPEPIAQPITQTQMSSERLMNEKIAPPSLIPVPRNTAQSRSLEMKLLPSLGNNSLAGFEAGEVEDNSTNSVDTRALNSNKAGIGAFGNGTTLPSVPPAAPSSLDEVRNDDVHSIVEPPAINTRLRSGSTFDLDDDPFVRGPLVRQNIPAHVTTATTPPVADPIDVINAPNESSELHSEMSNDILPPGEVNGGEEPTIAKNPLVINGTGDNEISKKILPLTPSTASVVDTIEESHPPVACISTPQKHHKHNESVATTYSNETDNDKSHEVEGEDTVDEDISPSPPYPLERHLCHPYLFHSLLKYLSYLDVMNVLSLNHSIRRSLTDIRDLREEILERFLHTVGYSRWNWQGKEPLALSVKDLNAYLRGVSTPMHEYATIADAYLAQHAGSTIPASRILRALAASCRSYTRLVIRLREHAEAEYAARSLPHAPISPGSPGSPTSMKHARHLSVQSATFSADSHDSSNVYNQQRSSVSSGAVQYRKFSSPLFRLHHAPLLRVFVPSANGAWLSDESVLECEKELKRAGVLPFLRPGDVVWDTAVAEEMNAGRLVWDGSYLIDMDYSYTLAGELPRYLHSLSFPPSYFHKVIQVNGNPLCQIDVSPWGAEIINNVQLVQDKAVTNIPQVAQHNVLRWTHRSRFQIIPGTPIPDSDGLVVDSKWVGTVVVEAEGTNEGLGNLLGRCGEQVAAKAEAMTGGLSNSMGKGEVGRAFRLIRSKSRPGEIWLRCVSEKEKLT